jgi:hypothetical protein
VPIAIKYENADAPQEQEQVFVDLVLMRSGQAVWRARIIEFLGALDQPGRLFRRVLHGNNLVILAM